MPSNSKSIYSENLKKIKEILKSTHKMFAQETYYLSKYNLEFVAYILKQSQITNNYIPSNAQIVEFMLSEYKEQVLAIMTECKDSKHMHDKEITKAIKNKNHDNACLLYIDEYMANSKFMMLATALNFLKILNIPKFIFESKCIEKITGFLNIQLIDFYKAPSILTPKMIIYSKYSSSFIIHKQKNEEEYLKYEDRRIEAFESGIFDEEETELQVFLFSHLLTCEIHTFTKDQIIMQKAIKQFTEQKYNTAPSANIGQIENSINKSIIENIPQERPPTSNYFSSSIDKSLKKPMPISQPASNPMKHEAKLSRNIDSVKSEALHKAEVIDVSHVKKKSLEKIKEEIVETNRKPNCHISIFSRKQLSVIDEIDIHLIVKNTEVFYKGIHYGSEEEIKYYIGSSILKNTNPIEIPCPDKECKLRVALPLVYLYFKDYCDKYADGSKP